MIKAVFLDIDNTLLSFEAYVKEAMKNGFEKYGLRPYEEWMFPVFETVNNGLWRQIEEATLAFEELQRIRWNRVFEALDISFDGIVFEKFFRQYLNESAIPEAGAMELLQYLDGRYVLCAASNGPYVQQVNRLRIGGMLDYFSCVFVSEKIGVSKPAKAFFDAALEELNADRKTPILPEEIMMVGDSLSSDMSGARNYGMKTCFYNKKMAAIPEDEKLDYIVSSLDEIPGIL